ncbi:MAG: 30S ribosomal protein S1 [Zetaproteobacteria bacterium]|nr:MAG: 30S ribosomal protein S1 [Zetaproteobacteria bacterium]
MDDEKTGMTQTPSDENAFQKLFEASLAELPEVRRGERVKGMVVSVDDQAVVVDVGAKAEGSIPKQEFEQAGLELPAVGEEVEAMVMSTGGPSGIGLSVLAVRRQDAWRSIEEAMENNACVDAIILAEVKGGYRVAIQGLEAFMPRSESDPNPRFPASELIGRTCKVAILEARRKPENIVVSRRRPLELEYAAKRERFFATAKVGDRVNGVVRRMTDFGAFVDLGGVDALLHVSDIAWQRLEKPSDILSVGQEVSVEITKIDPEAGKISVSMKALQEDPWTRVAERYEPGMRLTGTVRRLLDFGAVVELEPGVEGLIHRSELSWVRKDVAPTQVLAEGDVVDVAVLEVVPEERKLRLSLKAVTENPWQAWLAEHPVGSRVRGRIKNKTDFGFFVSVSDELDGLVHMENLSWEEDPAEALAAYSKGQEVECVVLGVDVERQRISLGIKQLSEDPFEVFLSGVQRGSTVTGKVIEVRKNGNALIELAKGVRAHLARREIPRDRELKEGDEIKAKITEINRAKRQVELSIRQYERDEERDAVRNYTRQVENAAGPSALALELQRKLLGGKKEK